MELLALFLIIGLIIYIVHTNKHDVQVLKNYEPIQELPETFKIGEIIWSSDTLPNKRYSGKRDEDGNLIIPCAGFQYNDAKKIRKWIVGKQIIFVPDPLNKYGKNTIKIYHKGFHIGFVPTELTSEVHEIIKDTFEATIYDYNPYKTPFFKLEILIKKLELNQ